MYYIENVDKLIIFTHTAGGGSGEGWKALWYVQ